MRYILISAFCMAFFSSCQKDDSQEPAQSVLSDQLLKKAVYSWPDGQTAWDFNYNADDKLLGVLITDLRTGKTDKKEFLRDNQNRIARIAITGNGVQTLRDIVYSGSSANTILYSSGISGALRDSIVYSYDAAGLVSAINMYGNRKNDGTITATLNLLVKKTFTYTAGGNLENIFVYTDHDSNGSFTLNFNYQFSYDTQTNPLYSPVDAAALIDDFWYLIASPNNVVRHVNKYGVQYPREDDDINYTYTYTTRGFPQACNYSLGDTKVKIDYYY